MNAIAQIVAQSNVAKKIEKADAKVAAAKKVNRATRPAQKPVAKKAESVAVKTAKAIAIKFAMIARPTAGGLLKAHTRAVIELLGMDKGNGVDRERLTKIMGPRAVAYHLNTTTAFEMTDKGIVLTAGFGSEYLGELRKNVSPADVDAFKAILTSGKADGRLLKNDKMLIAV